MRSYPKFEVVDETLVPPAYWMRVLNTVKIKSDVDMGLLKPDGDGPTTINGIRVWIERKVVASGR